MYVFLAELPPALSVWAGVRITSEGKLCWLPIDGICDPTADDVADNIPYFLPKMLSRSTPDTYEYYCQYQDGSLVQVIELPLSKSLKFDG
jgi:8-oxo-dGTP diphosphatase